MTIDQRGIVGGGAPRASELLTVAMDLAGSVGRTELGACRRGGPSRAISIVASAVRAQHVGLANARYAATRRWFNC